MNLNEVIENQIDTAIAGLMRSVRKSPGKPIHGQTSTKSTYSFSSAKHPIQLAVADAKPSGTKPSDTMNIMSINIHSFYRKTSSRNERSDWRTQLPMCLERTRRMRRMNPN